MRIICILLFFLPFLPGTAQSYKDTVLTVGEFSCACKYHINPEDDSRIFDHNAGTARYPGGEEAWEKFVKKNMDKSWKGKDKVEIRFQVDRNGDLASFMLLNKAPNQKYEEVVRLLKSSGKWFPSVQKGFCVKSYLRLAFEL